MNAWKKISLLLFAAVLLFLSGGVDASGKKADLNAYNKRTGQKFLEEVAARPGIHKLKSGMLVEVIQFPSYNAGANPHIY